MILCYCCTIHNSIQGSALPPSITNNSCDDATGDLLSQNDICSGTIFQVLSGNDSAVTGLFVDGCPTRFHDFVTACGGDGGFDVSINITYSSVAQLTIDFFRISSYVCICS